MKRVLALAISLSSFLAAQEFKLGSKVTNFTVNSLDGKAVDFDSLKGRLTVVGFVSVQCPISNDYHQRMIALKNDLGTKGVNFIFLNPNSTEPADAVASHAKTSAFNFAVYKDNDNRVADRFGASVTPEVFLIDAGGTVIYQGAIDDARNPSKVTKHGLRNALDAALAGKPVETSKLRAFGCTIKRKAS